MGAKYGCSFDFCVVDQSLMFEGRFLFLSSGILGGWFLFISSGIFQGRFLFLSSDILGGREGINFWGCGAYKWKIDFS